MITIEYFYSAHSAFAYLGARRLYEIAQENDACVVHRPMPLSPVVEAQGSLPFAQRTQAHVDYFFGREIERWAEWRGVDVVPFRPTFHDADYTLASGLILALGDRGPRVDAMAHAILQAHWRDDADLSDVGVLASLAKGLGHDVDALMAAAREADIAKTYTQNANAARALGVMGSPTYVVAGDVFYGQDRLEMVERALTLPFASTRWRNPAVG